MRQHDRQAGRLLGPDDRAHFAQVATEHLAVQKHQRGERLGLTARAQLPTVREHGQKVAHLERAQLGRVPETVVPHEPPHPGDVGLLRAGRVVTDPRRAPHQREELRCGSRLRSGEHLQLRIWRAREEKKG